MRTDKRDGVIRQVGTVFNNSLFFRGELHEMGSRGSGRVAQDEAFRVPAQQDARRFADAGFDEVVVGDAVAGADVGEQVLRGYGSLCRVGGGGGRQLAVGQCADAVGEGLREIVRREIAVINTAVVVVRSNLFVQDAAADKAADGGIQEGGRDEVVVGGGSAGGRAGEVSEDIEAAVDVRPRLRVVSGDEAVQFAGDDAFARPAVDEDEIGVGVMGEDVAQGVLVDVARGGGLLFEDSVQHHTSRYHLFVYRCCRRS